MDDSKGISRRDFFKRASVIGGGGTVLSMLIGKTLMSRFGRKRMIQDFPEDSIFTPAKKHRI